MNNKGFTLIELIVTLVILSLVISITAISITNVMKRSKEELYNNLVNNIIDAAEEYYIECKYAKNDAITCSSNGVITLGDLVKYGYLSGNDDGNRNKLINPLDNEDISSCNINITYNNNKIVVKSNSSSQSCPKNSDYER